MFDKVGKVKDLYALKKQADQMKKEMEKITVTVSLGDYELTMRGDQTIESITENGEENKTLVKLFNSAVKESQKKVAKKMRGQFSDMGLPGM